MDVTYDSLAAAAKEPLAGAQLLQEVGSAPLLRASDGKEVSFWLVCESA